MPNGDRTPMEDQQAYGGFVPALIQTWVQSCFRPAEFFQKVGNSRDLGPALIYGMVMGWIGSLLSAVVSALLNAPLIPFMSQKEAMGQMVGGMAGILFALFLGWLATLIGIVIASLIFHLFLLITGGAQQGLTMTMRAVSYALGPQIFQVVPFLGGLVGGIWTLVLDIIGLAAAHRTDRWRAAVAVLVPIAICCCLTVALFGAALLAAIGMAAQQGTGP